MARTYLPARGAPADEAVEHVFADAAVQAGIARALVGHESALQGPQPPLHRPQLRSGKGRTEFKLWGRKETRSGRTSAVKKDKNKTNKTSGQRTLRLKGLLCVMFGPGPVWKTRRSSRWRRKCSKRSFIVHPSRGPFPYRVADGALQALHPDADGAEVVRQALDAHFVAPRRLAPELVEPGRQLLDLRRAGKGVNSGGLCVSSSNLPDSDLTILTTVPRSWPCTFRFRPASMEMFLGPSMNRWPFSTRNCGLFKSEWKSRALTDVHGKHAWKARRFP